MTNYDDMKFAVEALSGGTNTVLLDDVGMPSIMVVIPKMLNSDLIPNGSETTHPAFIVQDIEIPKIYVSKYQNMVYNNRAYSLPHVVPRTTFKSVDAYSYAENKGTGWHVMTNAEWAAIALWCVKNGTLPHGNSNDGKSYRYSHEHGEYIPNSSRYTLTGTGSATWSHDHTIAGIYDLNGNYPEFVAGIYRNWGIINVIPNNDAALGAQINKAVDSDVWYKIDEDGSLVKTGGNYWRYRRSSNSSSLIMIGTNSSVDGGVAQGMFSEMAVYSGLTVPDILKYLALYPASPKEEYRDLDGEAYEYIYYSEPVHVTRGGSATGKNKSGIFNIGTGARGDTFMMTNTAFRAAYITI